MDTGTGKKYVAYALRKDSMRVTGLYMGYFEDPEVALTAFREAESQRELGPDEPGYNMVSVFTPDQHELSTKLSPAAIQAYQSYQHGGENIQLILIPEVGIPGALHRAPLPA